MAIGLAAASVNNTPLETSFVDVDVDSIDAEIAKVENTIQFLEFEASDTSLYHLDQIFGSKRQLVKQEARLKLLNLYHDYPDTNNHAFEIRKVTIDEWYNYNIDKLQK